MLLKIKFLLTFIVVSTSLCAQTSTWQSATDSEGAENEIVNLVSEDQEGNVFIAGTYLGDFSYEGESFEYSGNTNPSGSDAFLTKRSPDGLPLWSITLGDVNSQLTSIYGLQNDSEGNTYLCGTIVPAAPGLQVSFAGFELTVNPPNLTYICKIDEDGIGVWINTYAAGPGGFVITSNPTLGIDSDDNLILAGSFTGSIDFDGTILSSAPGQFDHFTCKFDADGNALWSISFGSSNTEQSLIQTVATDDGILLGGAWSGDSLFFGDLFVVNDDPIDGGNFDRWIGKLSSAGEVISLSREVVAGSSEFSARPKAMAPSSNGGAIVLSAVNQPITIGGEEIVENGLLITRYTSEGVLESVASVPGLMPSNSIIEDGNGDYFYAGLFDTPDITIGSDILINSGGATGTTDAVLIQCNENGEINYALQIGDSESEGITRLRMMSTGQLLVAGVYNSSSLTLGETALVNTGFLTNDFFLGYLGLSTGVIDLSANNSLKLFPNPTSAIVNIDMQEITYGNTSLRVFNSSGKEVHAANVTGLKSYQLQTSSFAKGLYLVELINDAGRYTGKVLVQ